MATQFIITVDDDMVEGLTEEQLLAGLDAALDLRNANLPEVLDDNTGLPIEPNPGIITGRQAYIQWLGANMFGSWGHAFIEQEQARAAAAQSK